MLSETVGSDVTRYVHALRGIQQMQNPTLWRRYMIQDGLGSVQSELPFNGASITH